MAWDRTANFKFAFRLTPDSKLDLWGIPGNFNLKNTLSLDAIQSKIQKRELLHFTYSNIEDGLQEFSQKLRQGILHWYEDPWVFFTSSPTLKDRQIKEKQILYIAPSSAPQELLWLEALHEKFPNQNFSQTSYFEKEKLLLHVCCGPDAAGVVAQLKEDFDLRCYWYDPNIQPKAEHDLRLQAFEKVMNIFQIPYDVGPYDVENFEGKIALVKWSPEQGAKCSICYDMRLENAALFARERGIPNYATTLAISPHKVQKKLMQFGELNFKKWGTRYYHKNFMKKDGFMDSVEFTEKHDIYRQDYCGCFYSLHEGGPDAKSKANEWGYLPEEP